LRDQLIWLSNDKDVSVRESQGIIQIASTAKKNEAYNRLYAATLPLARNIAKNPTGLDIYWSVINDRYLNAEKDYNYAKKNNSSDLAQKKFAFEAALTDQNAGTNVKFDV